jgi:C4-type Zn-finger protein
MVDLEIQEQEYHCENCNFLDDEPVPSECRKGRGQVAYFHRVCGNFQLRSGVKKSEDLSSKDE